MHVAALCMATALWEEGYACCRVRSECLSRHCEEYEAAIAAAGGIDLQLLGLGRMGHIGFNERGCADSSCRKCRLHHCHGLSHPPRWRSAAGLLPQHDQHAPTCCCDV